MLSARWLRGAAVAFTAGTIGAAAYWAIAGDYAYLIAVLLLQAAFSIPQRRGVQQALHAAEAPARDLDVLAHVLGRLEREDFKTVGLAALRRQLDTPAAVGSPGDPTNQHWPPEAGVAACCDRDAAGRHGARPGGKTLLGGIADEPHWRG